MHPDVMIHHLILCHENKIASLIMIMNSQSAQGRSSQDPLSQVPSHPHLHLTYHASGKEGEYVNEVDRAGCFLVPQVGDKDPQKQNGQLHSVAGPWREAKFFLPMFTSILLQDKRKDGLFLPHTQGVLLVLHASTVYSWFVPSMEGAPTGLSKCWALFLDLLEECEPGKREVADVKGRSGWE